jgi:hypothetical protein
MSNTLHQNRSKFAIKRQDRAREGGREGGRRERVRERERWRDGGREEAESKGVTEEEWLPLCLSVQEV